MRELLEKWVEFGEKAPAWDGMVFRVLPPLIDNRWNIAHSGQTFQMEHPEVQGHHILAATIEAITARDWHWSVGNSLQRPYRAQVDTKTRTTVERADSPAEALLRAYLSALEAA